jgi:nucleotide-binding universal stress UspA family protein
MLLRVYRSNMYRLLVPVDRDIGRAVHQSRYVNRLAETVEDVEATVLFVVTPETFGRAEDVEFEEVDAAVEAADTIEAAGIDVRRVVDDGGAAEQIVRTADDHDVDEIVVAGRDRSGVARVLLGSTVNDVVVSTERPVTVTGERVVLGEGVRHLLVPVDRDVDRALRQTAYVSSLHETGGDVEATVLYVFPHQDYTGAPSHVFAEVQSAVEAADDLEASGIPVERVAVGGEVVSTILDAAEERDVDGIVMGGRKRSGVQKVLLGSTSLDAVLSAQRAVTIAG